MKTPFELPDITPEKAFDDLFKTIETTAQKTIRANHEVPPTVFALLDKDTKSEGKFGIANFSVANLDFASRDLILQGIGHKLAKEETRTLLFAFAGEAWGVAAEIGSTDELIAPSLNPKRFEVLVVSAQTFDGKRKVKFFKIVDKDGKREVEPYNEDEEITSGVWIENKGTDIPDDKVKWHDRILGTLWREYDLGRNILKR